MLSHFDSVCNASPPPHTHTHIHIRTGYSQLTHELRAADKVILSLDSLALKDLYMVNSQPGPDASSSLVIFLLMHPFILSFYLFFFLTHCILDCSSRYQNVQGS